MTKLKNGARFALTAGLCAALTFGGFVPTALADQTDLDSVATYGSESDGSERSDNQSPATDAMSQEEFENKLREAADREAGTVTLEKDVELTSQVTIPAGVSVNGNGYTISIKEGTTWSATDSEKYMLLVAGDNAVISNVVIDAENNAYGCLQFYKANGGQIENVTLKNARQLGLNVNASDVTATGEIRYEGNGWGNGINVSFGSDISDRDGSSFNASGATLVGVSSVYADDGDMERSGNKITISTADNYVPVADPKACGDTVAVAYLPKEGAVTVASNDTNTFYRSIENAISSCTSGDSVTLNGNLELSKKLTIGIEGLTLDLGGHTVTAAAGFVGTEDFDKHLIDVTADSVTVKNGTLKSGVETRQALNVFEANNVRIEDLTLDHSLASTGNPLTVNASTVTVGGELTLVSGASSWYGADVSFGGDPTNVNTGLTFDEGSSLVLSGTPASKLGILVTGADGKTATANLQNISGIKFSEGTESYPVVGTLTSALGNGVTVSVPASLLEQKTQEVSGSQYALWTLVSTPSVPTPPTGGGNGGGGSTTVPEGDTTTNPDGSTTTTVTEETENADGSTTTTVTETTEGREDGSTTQKVTETTRAEDGTETVRVTETNTLEDGTKATVVTEDGKVSSVEATVSQEAADEAKGSAVALPVSEPIAPAAPDAAPEISVAAPEGTKVAVPVAKADGAGEVAPGAVLVLVGADGTERVLPKTANTGDALSAELPGDCTIKVVDASVDYPDVPQGAWYEGVADFASSRGILRGVPAADGSVEFRADQPTTRAMFVAMLNRVESDAVAGEGFQPGLSGVDGYWFEAPAAWALQEGLLAGYPDGTFRGDDDVTREQIAAFMMRYAEWLGLDVSARSDEATGASDWAADAMSWAVAEGLILGDEQTGALRPTDGATRAEAAAIVARFVNMIG